jgi:hypothetical protein
VGRGPFEDKVKKVQKTQESDPLLGALRSSLTAKKRQVKNSRRENIKGVYAPGT